MNKLLAFLYKRRIFILFLALQFISLTLYFTFNNFQRAAYINSSNSVIASLMNTKSNITSYLHLKEDNLKLAKENALLREQLNQNILRYNRSFLSVNDTLYKQQYEYIPVKVINTTLRRGVNFLTLNNGSKDGIEKGMGVITDDGIVGIIQHVSENFSTVRTILDNSKYPFSPYVELEHSKYYGPLKWNQTLGTNQIYLQNIPRHAHLFEGEPVYSKGSGSIFPSGIEIGEINNINKVDGGNFLEITLKLNTDFTNLQYVYIVKNLLKKEQLLIEEESTNNIEQ